jgi:hypothetical protein
MVVAELFGALLIATIIDSFEVNPNKVAPPYPLEDPTRLLLSWFSVSSLDLLVSDVDQGFPLLLDFSWVVLMPQFPPGEVLSPSLNGSGFLGSSPLFPFCLHGRTDLPLQ